MESRHFLGAAIMRAVKSEEWAELVRRGFDALQQGELDLFDEMSTPDLVLIQPPEVPDAKTYEGRGAVREAMEDWPNQWEDFRLDLLEIVEIGDDVAVSVTRHRGRGSGSGIEMDFEVFYVHQGRDGKLARMEMFFSREQALEAARQLA
jgi:ketosteroid isomerase-like protein